MPQVSLVAGYAHSFWVVPFPVPDFRHVLAVLVDVLLVLDELVLELLLQVDALVAGLRQAVDGVHHQVEAVQVVQHRYVNFPSFGWFGGVISAIRTAVRDDHKELNHWGVQWPDNQPDAASFMILTIVSSTSCATPFSCGTLNIARRVVGFKVARMVLPSSS